MVALGPHTAGVMSNDDALANELLSAAQRSGEEMWRLPLPPRLAELLLARTARCGGDGQAVLAALAVAGRPLTERLVGEVTGPDAPTVRTAVRDLTAARLLGAPADGGYRPRHALLAEAVVAELLPGEQIALHERIAGVLQAAGDDMLAAEAAGHWAAAGRTSAELQARLQKQVGEGESPLKEIDVDRLAAILASKAPPPTDEELDAAER